MQGDNSEQRSPGCIRLRERTIAIKPRFVGKPQTSDTVIFRRDLLNPWLGTAGL
jgi:hypothetical protein